MSGSSFWSIQQALVAKLRADATLMSRITGVFDEIKQNTTFPYVTVGEFTSRPWRTQTRFGEEVTVTLHIWSRYKGFKESFQILDDVNRVLADQDLNVTGWDAVTCYYEFSDAYNDPDGITRHVPVRFRIQIQKGV